MPSQPLIPSSFLPHLPRFQNSFDPLSTNELLGHIAVLRELYVPPVHGGFEVSDCLLEDEEYTAGNGVEILGGGSKDGGVAGLNGKMNGLGLHIESSAPMGIPTNGVTDGSGSRNGHSTLSESEHQEDGNQEQDGEEEEESREHLDPFERDWSEKWLNGVVRRAQGWLEENESEDDAVHTEWRIMEGILRDASAALAMMAGTSGMFLISLHLIRKRVEMRVS
jgi:hypothetical protein